MKTDKQFTLQQNADQILLRFIDEEEEIPVRLVWARPLSGNGRDIAIIRVKPRKEIAMVHNLAELDEQSQAIVKEALGQRYFLPKITRVIHTRAHFGNRYWEVETDRGLRSFLIRSPEVSANWLSEDRCILTDLIGNCYEIESLRMLDIESRQEAEKIL